MVSYSTEQHVEKILTMMVKLLALRAAGTEYRANKGVISNIDAKRVFLAIDGCRLDHAEPSLRERLRANCHFTTKQFLKF